MPAHEFTTANTTMPADAVYKIVLIGDTGVGKSSLLLRFADDSFCQSHLSTIGVDFKVRSLRRDDGKIIKLQLWDTAGQERFRTITTAYYRNADGIILVYSSADRNSFENVSHWMSEIQRYSHGCVQLLVANKSDLVSSRQVDPSQATEAAESLGIPYIETSAKDALNVEAAFYKMVDQITENRLACHRTPIYKSPNHKGKACKTGEVVELAEGRFTSVAAWLTSRCSIM